MNSWKELALLLVSAGLLLSLWGAAASPRKEPRLFCEQNLKKLYQYTLQYENDHGGLPPVRIPMKPLWKFWSNLLKSYSKDSYDFVCPADPRAAFLFEKVRSPLYHPQEFNASCYGMNWFLTDKDARKHKKEPKLENLSRPGNTVFLGDSKGPYMLPPRFWTYEKAFRHEGEKANFIYADGHVKFEAQSDFGKFENGKFATDFTKWHWN